VSPRPPPLLEAHDVHVDFPSEEGWVRAVEGVSFWCCEGEAVGVVGESGCGKTTLALSVARLLPAEARVSGRIQFGGVDLLALPSSRLRHFRGARIGVVPHNSLDALNPYQRAGEQVAEGIRAHAKLDRVSARRKAVELLDAVGLPSPATVSRSFPHQLSGGMRQLVLLATALASPPDLLVLDEPFSSLDRASASHVIDLLSELRASRGMGLLLVTHDLGLLSASCSRVFVMYAGKIVEKGTVEGILKRPQHPYTMSLLAPFIRMAQPKGKRISAIAGEPPSLARPPAGCRFHPRCPASWERCRLQVPNLESTGTHQALACHLPPADRSTLWLQINQV
jgi:oligopeptide/dipeptide ABC transporter ATP-binding protein